MLGRYRQTRNSASKDPPGLWPIWADAALLLCTMEDQVVQGWIRRPLSEKGVHIRYALPIFYGKC